MTQAFDPTEINLLAKVIDAACREVRCADQTAKEMLAVRVIDVANRGERNFDVLLSAALRGEVIGYAA
jgi:hypothetical protein